jgi:hypothetical protein
MLIRKEKTAFFNMKKLHFKVTRQRRHWAMGNMAAQPKDEEQLGRGGPACQSRGNASDFQLHSNTRDIRQGMMTWWGRKNYIGANGQVGGLWIGPCPAWSVDCRVWTNFRCCAAACQFKVTQQFSVSARVELNLLCSSFRRQPSMVTETMASGWSFRKSSYGNAPITTVRHRAPLHLAPRTFLKKPHVSYDRTRPAPRTMCALAPPTLRRAPLHLARLHKTRLGPHAAHPVRASHHAPRAALPRTASTSLHWMTASWWAYVVIICFMCFRCIWHMFHLDIVKVDRVFHML